MPATTDKDGSGGAADAELSVNELPDGSATVEGGDFVVALPAGQAAAGTGADDDHDGDPEGDERPRTGTTESEQAELDRAANEEERAAIRLRRKNERIAKRQRLKDRDEARQRETDQLRQQNRALMERVGLIERKATGAELAQLDTAISEAEQAYTLAKEAQADAVTRNDGAASAQATERMVMARERHSQLSNIRKQYTATPQRQTQPIDPRLMQHAQVWAARNPWYNAANPDTDTRIALALDKDVADAGFSPTTKEYWDELDRRVEKYLPHRAGKKSDTEQDILQSPVRTPNRSVVTGGGRDAAAVSGASAFVLSPARVQAVKDAGMWNDPVQRNKMIREYREYDRTHPAAKT